MPTTSAHTAPHNRHHDVLVSGEGGRAEAVAVVVAMNLTVRRGCDGVGDGGEDDSGGTILIPMILTQLKNVLCSDRAGEVTLCN